MMGPDWLVLAQGTAEERDLLTIVILCSVLLVLLLVLGMLVLWYRKRFVVGGPGQSGEPLTLGDLRDLRDRGLVSEEEFERLKATIIRDAQAAAGLGQAAMQKATGGRSDNAPGAAPAAGEQDEGPGGSSPPTEGPTAERR